MENKFSKKTNFLNYPGSKKENVRVRVTSRQEQCFPSKGGPQSEKLTFRCQALHGCCSGAVAGGLQIRIEVALAEGGLVSETGDVGESEVVRRRVQDGAIGREAKHVHIVYEATIVWCDRNYAWPIEPGTVAGAC